MLITKFIVNDALLRFLIPTNKTSQILYREITVIRNFKILHGDVGSSQLMLTNQS